MPKFLSKVTAALALLATPTVLSAAEIVTAPADYVFIHEANPSKGYVDVMVQTILIHNDSTGPVTITGLQIDAIGGTANVLTKNIPIEQAIRQTKEFASMAAQGMDVFLKAQLLNERGISEILDPGSTLSEDEHLNAGEALIITSQYFATDAAPDAIVLTATFTTHDEKIETKRRRLEVIRRKQEFEYIAPLSGDWLMRSAPNIASHHRFIPSNEFALDFFKTGRDGARDKGDKLSPNDDYGFGDPVMAVADGEVVFVIDDQVQNPDALTRRDGESLQAARSRITQYQMKRYVENFRAAAGGNLITIKHTKNGRTEYSSYGHLKTGSITVKVGDKVKQGDIIGAVGNTGDSTLTHLHFQLNDGPDAFHSRSLPISFSNAAPQYRGQEPGIFITFTEKVR